jgi:hypothetical protein
MNKRLPYLFLILSVAMWLTLPSVPAVAQSTSYQEGAILSASQGFTIANQQAYLKATKTITESGGRITHVSVLELSIVCPYSQGGPRMLVRTSTIPVPGDPDNLEVSRDLGWAGLDTTVSVFDEISGTNVTIEIHAYWWATEGVAESGGLFTRRVRLEGSIVTPKCTFDLSRRPGPANATGGSTFSTREPYPRY